VIVKGTEFFDGKTKKYVDFPITDVLQMVGRAGRPQFDTSAVAHIFVEETKKEYYKKFLYEPFPVESRILDYLPDHLNAEISGKTINSVQEAVDYLTWTYFFRRVLKNPSFYGLDEPDPEKLNEFLSNVIETGVAKLVNAECVRLDKSEEINVSDAITITPYGQIASYYYLDYRTMGHYLETMHSENTEEDILQILSNSHEFAELPVRHNEDVANEQWQKDLPIKLRNPDWNNSNVKTHLLLQAHMSRVDMPIVDYKNDLKTVLDNAIRLCQAMLDVCVVNGWLVSGMNLIRLMQGLSQGFWPNEPASRMFADNRLWKRNFAEIVETWNSKKQDTIFNLVGDKETEWLSRMPVIDVKISLNGAALKLSHHQMELRDVNTWNLVKKGAEHGEHGENDGNGQNGQKTMNQGENGLKITLRKLNKESIGKLHACCPRYPKPKLEGYFLFLAERNSKDIVALKRIANIRGSYKSESLAFDMSELEVGKMYIYTVFVMSDSYLEMDQCFDIRIKIGE